MSDTKNLNEAADSGLLQPRLVVPLDFARWWNRGYQRYRDDDRHLERMPSTWTAFNRRCERVREKSLAAERRSRQLHRERFPEFVRHNVKSAATGSERKDHE